MIAFLVKTFPKLSETFVHGEIAGLERTGVRMALFALARPADDLADHRDLRTAVRYVPDPARGRADRAALLIAQAALALGAPDHYRAVRAWAEAHHGRDAGRALLARAAWLARALVSAGVRHLHVHFADGPADVAELAGRLARIGFSLSAHAKDIYLQPQAPLARKLAAARFVVTCTDYNRRFLSALAGDTPVARMYHGIDLARLRRGAPAGADAQAPLVLAVGRLREKKGFSTLVEACGILATIGARFRCEIVGYGPDAAALEAAIAQRGLRSHVTLAGKLPHAEVVARYRRAAVFVLPCQVAADGDRDGIPNVLLEAMAMSVPVVSTAVSGIPEAVADERNGLLVAPADPLALARAIARILDDPALAARLAAAGRATVERLFDGDRNLTVVRDLLAAATPPAGRSAAPATPETVHVG